MGAATDFRHQALLYEGDDGFLEGTLPFIEEGVAGGEPVLVVVGADKIDLLRDHLDGAADGVQFADMAHVGRNPAHIIPAWRDFLDAHGGDGRPCRGIGEPIYPTRRPAELVECQRHEWLLNVAFAGAPAWSLLCPYDTAALDGAVVDVAHRTHPFVVAGQAEHESAAYGDGDPCDDLGGQLPPAPDGADELVFTGGPLWPLRREVSERAVAAGLDAARAANFTLSVNEVVTNSIRHGGGQANVRMWHDAGAVVCEVRDAGRVDDPLIGRVRPRVDGESGRGMWLANQLSDLVQVRSSATGTVVRVHMWVS